MVHLNADETSTTATIDGDIARFHTALTAFKKSVYTSTFVLLSEICPLQLIGNKNYRGRLFETTRSGHR